MRHYKTFLLVCVLAAAAGLVNQPLRAGTLGLIRAPFSVLTLLVRTLLLLPRLPALSIEQAHLKEELTKRSLELAQAREELRHAKATEGLLRPSGGSQGIPASVIGRSPIPSRHTILISRGKRQGVLRDAVLVDDKGVVGRVIEAHGSTGLAMLLTDPNSRVAALVERSRESGLLIGEGHGMCRLIWLDADADIEQGDRIITAGLQGPFPKGLWLGVVVSILRDEEAGSATAVIQPSGNLSQLEEVLCLLPSAS